MNVDKTIEGDRMTLTIDGRVDITTAPILERAFDECAEQAHSIVFDCRGMEYISSVGLRILAKAHKAMLDKGGMKLTNVNDPVMEVFNITGFSDILAIE